LLNKKFKYVEEWCSFVEENHKNDIALDTWKQFLEFVLEFDNFDLYDLENSSYPVIIDEFVIHMKKLK
jgi:DCN1-like protein 1/2